ncbi:MAG: hypothetical protein U0797_30675 [Gemmataceae bacterium]
MSESPEGSAPYRVVYSEHVRAQFRRLGDGAIAVGRGEEFVAALRELDRLSRIYPQFGEPTVDLLHEVGQTYRCAVPPLVVRYAVLEERRIVMVAEAPQLLPNSGFDDVPGGDL